jgi:hypothetical protein
VATGGSSRFKAKGEEREGRRTQGTREEAGSTARGDVPASIRGSFSTHFPVAQPIIRISRRANAKDYDTQAALHDANSPMMPRLLRLPGWVSVLC